MIYTQSVPRKPCILIVDESASTRNSVKHILESEGYEVLVARHGIEALVLAADFPRPIDILLSDAAVKAAYNGVEIAACFHILRPETQIVLTSDKSYFEEDGSDHCDWEILHKPLSK